MCKRLDHKEVESGSGAAMEMLRATNKDNDTALHIAVRNPRNSGVLKDIEFIRPPNNAGVVEWLTKENPKFTHPPNNAKETPLYLAAERQRNDMVSMILKNCTSPANGGPKGQTALHAAASDRQEIEKDKSVAYITTCDEDDEKAALHIAAARGNVRVMEELLSQCPDFWEMVNSKRQNILHIAVDME
ncbi:Ankyrin repeat-containing protein [Camellia lanceoleosa]|uniref:Ankyrin repeat-containing protein n=1 Tax=Camellia lanceoleosa TaxID=1840588 RepID=A0ACC0GQS4_9ERIC|nr:Ankyrin repeat-containing protein [Camellia lanceoleosa]